MVDYNADVDTEAHEAEWLSNYGSEGALQFFCDDGRRGSILLSAGWAHMDVCPVCGTELSWEVEEV